MGTVSRPIGAAAVLLCGILGMAACGEEASAPLPPPWARVAPEQIDEAKKHGVPVAFENDLGMRFVLIPAGTFVMGPPEDETQNEVTLTKPYYIQTTEVTNGDLRRFLPGYRSGTFGGLSLDSDRQPVACVSWEVTQQYVAWLSARDSQWTYALPTEDQWEYACRAGSTTTYWWGEDAEDAVGRANCADKRMTQFWRMKLGQQYAARQDDSLTGDDGHTVTAPVGSFAANGWGLQDMLGNVMEWCTSSSPRFHEKLRAASGGAWFSPPVGCSVRGQFNGSLRFDGLGFRLVSPLPEE